MTSTFLHQNTSGGGLHGLRSACSGQGFFCFDPVISNLQR